MEETQKLPLSLRSLERISWNYWWSWSADGASVFRDLDPDIWEQHEQNPRQLLTKTSDYRITQMATDPVYIERVRNLAIEFDEYMAQPLKWAAPATGASVTAENPVAYFCAEYGVHNSLPVYSGGLGILAGDHLKSASDLGLPLVAIGLLYHYGYFRQRLRRDGWQEEYYGETFPTELPLTLLKDENDSVRLIEVDIRQRQVKAQVWQAQVGRVPLYLLDTNISINNETDRWVTGHLYGGDRETRIVQEMLLGIGGVRLLRQLEIEPHVFHLNEGHSAFLTLELARELIESHAMSFAEATPLVRERCVFTTHTPVAAGNDEFDPSLVQAAFGEDYPKALGLDNDAFIDLGRTDTTDDAEPFGLTPLAIRMCRSTNGVSRKHGEVSRALWKKLFPGATVDQVPITHVTNGVHTPTWVAPLIRSLFEKYVGANWTYLLRDSQLWQQSIEKIPDEELWGAHQLLKNRLIAFIRFRSFQARLARGESMEYTESARRMFDPRTLTIGFARRAAGYKRWSLLLTDPTRLLRILNTESRPVQFVFAGKAHPQDQQAKLILQQISQWKYDSLVRNRAVFLHDYDQEIARQLVHSVDVWLNVPRRPLEASGTSGEKVAINGGLNFSILDGWWLEGYDSTNGFGIGGENDLAGDDVDTADAEALYQVLEEQIIPLYYDRDTDEIPHRWVAMMKRSMQSLIPAFNSDRMVAEYAERIYSEVGKGLTASD